MEDGLEFGACVGVGENEIGELVAFELPVRTDESVSKGVLNFSESRLSGFNNLPRQIISIHHRHSAFSKDGSGSGFTHANAAGDA